MGDWGVRAESEVGEVRGGQLAGLPFFIPMGMSFWLIPMPQRGSEKGPS